MSHKLFSSFITFLLFSLSFTLFNCQSKDFELNENAVVFTEFPKETNGTFKKLFDFNKGVAYNLHLVDSTLILFNEKGKENFFFYNYSLKNRTLSKGYLSGGRGPGQSIAAFESGVIEETLWAFDITLRRVFTIDKETALTQANDSILSFNQYPVKESFYKISFKDNLHYLAVGAFDTKFKIQEIEAATGKIVNEFGTFKSIPSNMDFNAYKSAHQSFIYTKPTGDKTVLMYRFTDAIEIFDLNSKKGKSIHGPEAYPVDFKPLNAGDFFVMERTPKTRYAFVTGTVTDQFIYAIYSGKFEGTHRAYHGNLLFIYDWDGNPIKKITLDRDVFSLAVSNDDKTLYAYEANTGFILTTKIN